jgi:hypothetical protein
VIPHLTVGHRLEPPHELDAELRHGLPIAARASDVAQLEEFAHHRWRERRRYTLGGRGPG